MHKLYGMLMLLLLQCAPFNAQIRFTGAGAGAGIGSIQSTSPSVFAYSTRVFADAAWGEEQHLIYRVSGWFLKDFNSLVPNNTLSSYYSYLAGVSAEGIFSFRLDSPVFINYGAGCLYLADHTFSKEKSNGFGVLVTASLSIAPGGGLHENEGLTAGIEVNSGMTFTGTQPRMFSLTLFSRFPF